MISRDGILSPAPTLEVHIDLSNYNFLGETSLHGKRGASRFEIFEMESLLPNENGINMSRKLEKQLSITCKKILHFPESVRYNHLETFDEPRHSSAEQKELN